MSFKVSDFVSKFDFEVSDEFMQWHYVIEIYQTEQQFYPKVYRWESFLLTPTETDLVTCEEKLLVKDEFSVWEDMLFGSQAAVKNHVIEFLKQRFEC